MILALFDMAFGTIRGQDRACWRMIDKATRGCKLKGQKMMVYTDKY